MKFTFEYLSFDSAANQLDCTRTDLFLLAAEGGIDCYFRPRPEFVIRYRPDCIGFDRIYNIGSWAMDNSDRIVFGMVKKIPAWKFTESLSNEPLSIVVYIFGIEGVKTKLLLEIADLSVKSEDVNQLLNKPMVVAEDKSYYSSELLILIEAAEKFWKNADLNDKDTQPKQQEVSDWLASKGLSKASADQGAVIIRPSNARVGRPKSN